MNGCIDRLGPCLLLLLSALPAAAQDPRTDAAAPNGAIRVFVDCRSHFCDFDFFRTEIDWISYVRDRQSATLHVLITPQATGGGTEFTINFIGQERLEGKSDTLRYVSRRTDSQDEVRHGLAATLKLGLVRYVAGTAPAERLRIAYDPPAEQEQASGEPVYDPWNYWIFRTGVRGFFNGEQSTRFTTLNGSLSANRTTEAWKVNLSLSAGIDESSFEVEDGTIRSTQRNYGATGLLVGSVGGHWSAGARITAVSSTFLNQRLAVRLAPALEYNLFPYSESTRRQLRVLYSTGANSVSYHEVTIFDRTQETLLDHNLTISLDVRQQWGSTSASIEASQYLSLPDQYRLSAHTNLDLRVVKGLSLNLFGSASLLRDQLYLARRGASDEEILLRRRQLETSYRYFASIGVSYTFGSIYNNVVNPRFGGTGGGIIFFN